MKKSSLIFIPIIVLIIAVVAVTVSLRNREKEQPVDNPLSTMSSTSDIFRNVYDDENEIPMDGDKDFEQKDIDLDNDGTEENIKVSTVTTGGGDQGGIQEVTGRLEVTGKDGTDDISFIIKPQSLAGIMSGIKFIDLDGDGVKDIFVAIPDTGNLFTTNTLFIFNYKTKKMYSFPGDQNDFNFDNFVKGFSFSYKGKGLLEMKNSEYNFKGVIDLKSSDNITNSEDNNKKYGEARVDPTPVMMDDSAKLKLIKDKKNKLYIKMPLAIYGINTTDVIGEVELYFDVSSDFKTEFKKFTVIGYDGNNKVKVGEAKARQGN